MTKERIDERGNAERVSALKPPANRDQDRGGDDVADPSVEVGLAGLRRSVHSEDLAANDNSHKKGRAVTHDDLRKALMAQPIRQRVGVICRWSHQLSDGAGLMPADPIGELFILQWMMRTAFVEASEMTGLPVDFTQWADYMSDPLTALQQVKVLSAAVLDHPAFQEATDSSNLTVH